MKGTNYASLNIINLTYYCHYFVVVITKPISLEETEKNSIIYIYCSNKSYLIFGRWQTGKSTVDAMPTISATILNHTFLSLIYIGLNVKTNKTRFIGNTHIHKHSNTRMHKHIVKSIRLNHFSILAIFVSLCTRLIIQ